LEDFDRFKLAASQIVGNRKTREARKAKELGYMRRTLLAVGIFCVVFGIFNLVRGKYRPAGRDISGGILIGAPSKKRPNST
jgi:hypothetical protein